MLLKATTGKETFSTGTAQHHVFLVPTNHALSKETHIGIVAKANNASLSVRQDELRKHPVVSGSMVDHGTYWEGTYDVPDGAILKLFGQRTVSPAASGTRAGQRMAAAKLIQMRQGAALRRVTFLTTGNPKATFNRVTVEGRFDFIDLKQAFRLGAKLDVTQIKPYTSPFMDRLFREEVLDREIASRPVTVTHTVRGDDGSERRVQTSAPRRALDLD